MIYSSDPTITVTVTGRGGGFQVGQSTSLSCAVSGTDNLLNPTLTYMWQRDGETLTGQVASSLMLTDLTTSDSGSYTCVVTVSDNLFTTPIIRNAMSPKTIRIFGGFYQSYFKINVIIHYRCSCSQYSYKHCNHHISQLDSAW